MRRLAPWSFVIGGLATWRPGDYGQLFDFDTGGADQLSTITTQAWPGEAPVSSAQSLGTWDNLGHLSQVDSVTRLRDPLGNTTHTQLLEEAADMVYDGANRLRRVTRTGDGTVVEYSYRADGVLARRQVVCGPTAVGCLDADRTYVYDGQLLLETWESGTTPVARYYYADEDDVPLAMDSWNGVAFERYYFVVDRVGSVLGLLNAQGAWVERTQYGVWGRPTMEQADLQAPEVHQIIVEPNGEMVVVFTEPVLPPPLVGAPGLVPLADLSGVMWLDEGGVSIFGTTTLEEDYPGVTRGSALRFVPNGTPAALGQVTLQMNAGALVDRWMNANAQIALQFMWSVGTPHTGPPQVTPIVLERSLVGNELGFQSHLMDDDVDLIHMRARVFDPHTGLFLQLDPSGYRDSVNLYAGLAWDTVNNRDPTGANVVSQVLKGVAKKVVKRSASRAGKVVKGSVKKAGRGIQRIRTGIQRRRSQVTVFRAQPVGESRIVTGGAFGRLRGRKGLAAANKERKRLLRRIESSDPNVVRNALAQAQGSGRSSPVISTTFDKNIAMERLADLKAHGIPAEVVTLRGPRSGGLDFETAFKAVGGRRKRFKDSELAEFGIPDLFVPAKGRSRSGFEIIRRRR